MGLGLGFGLGFGLGVRAWVRVRSPWAALSQGCAWGLLPER